MQDGCEPVDDQDDVDRLEERIAALAIEIARCRKLSTVARLLIWAGLIALALLLIGALAFSPEYLIAAMAALIGGVVLLGSNASTWEQSERALQQAEEDRSELIAGLALRVVGEERPTLH